MRTLMIAPVLLAACAVDPAGVTDGDCTFDERIEAYVDGDSDGYGAGEAMLVCALTKDLVDNRLDCDDANANVHPGAEETCNRRDDNCNGRTDETFEQREYFADVDGDGFGGIFPKQVTCGQPDPGFVSNSADCNDNDASINPTMPEICNGNIDDDCNGVADDLDANTLASSKRGLYVDADHDGFGDLNNPQPRCNAVAGLVENFVDCDDSDPSVTHTDQIIDADHDGFGAAEGWTQSCPGYPGTSTNRDDCDDNDDNVTVPKNWYFDRDLDGFGDELESHGCFPPNDVRVSSESGDCNDSDARFHPEAPEDCDEGVIDYNCNGQLGCADALCDVNPVCWQACVDRGLGTTVPLTLSLDFVNMVDQVRTSCHSWYGASGSESYQWRAPEAGRYRFRTINGEGQWTNNRAGALEVLSECDGTVLGCTYNSYLGVIRGVSQWGGNVTLNLEKNQTVILRPAADLSSAGTNTADLTIERLD